MKISYRCLYDINLIVTLLRFNPFLHAAAKIFLANPSKFRQHHAADPLHKIGHDSNTPPPPTI